MLRVYSRLLVDGLACRTAASGAESPVRGRFTSDMNAVGAIEHVASVPARLNRHGWFQPTGIVADARIARVPETTP